MKGSNKINIVRLIINILAFVLAAVLIIGFFASGFINQIKQAIPVYIGIVIVLAGIPSLMALGNRMIIKQDSIISTQILFNQPISFNKRPVIWGYVIMFFPLYLFILGTLLLPYDSIWIMFFIPSSVITFVLSRLKAEMLTPFKISRRKYKLCHFGAYSFSIITGVALRFTLIIPLIERFNG